MFELKCTTNKKVNIKNLTIADGQIVNEDGIIKDLNKIVAYAFKEGDTFDFTVTNKTDDTEIVEEDARND